MYDNIGSKLRTVAMVCGIIGVIGAGIGLLALLTGGGAIGLAAIVSGLLALISSWPLYAFGQITDDIHAMRNGTAAPTGQTAAAVDDDLPEL